MARTKTTPKLNEAEFDLGEPTQAAYGPPMASLKVKRLDSRATLPRFAHASDACFDIFASEGATLYGQKEHHGQARLFHTGLAFEIPKGYVLNVYSRSGMGVKHGIRLGNSVGVVDQGYRGELFVALYNDSNIDYRVEVGDRIAQGRLEYVVPTKLVEVSELAPSDRGVSGVGSTGR